MEAKRWITAILTPRVGILLLAIGYAFAFIPPLTIEGKPIALGGYLSALFIVTGWGIFSTMLFPIVTKVTKTKLYLHQEPV